MASWKVEKLNILIVRVFENLTNHEFINWKLLLFLLWVFGFAYCKLIKGLINNLALPVNIASNLKRKREQMSFLRQRVFTCSTSSLSLYLSQIFCNFSSCFSFHSSIWLSKFPSNSRGFSNTCKITDLLICQKVILKNLFRSYFIKLLIK